MSTQGDIKRVIVELERVSDKIDSERARSIETAVAHRQLIDEIPMGLPDGTGILGPLAWVKWAKKKLGYPERLGE